MRHTCRYKEQNSGYQWGEGSKQGKDTSEGLRDTDYYVENKENTRIYYTVQGI